jgi:putative otitis media-associated P41
MNMLYLIGNGFDLNLGLPTRYSDFFEHYFNNEPQIPQATSQEISQIKKYKGLLSETIENNAGDQQWKDLEIALGKFSSHFSDPKDFRFFYTDINLSLTNYLKQISPISPTENDIKKLIENILYPEHYLNEREKQTFYKAIRRGNHWEANVISFNYTSSFEQICKDRLSFNTYYRRPSDTEHFSLKRILHIHGSLEENSILLGVDNTKQIDNADFKDNEDVTDLLVKPQGNKNIGNLIDETCHDLISNADLICLFGLSLGATDQTWWEDIKERFISNSSVVLLYFYHDLHSGISIKSDGRSKRKARAHIVKALGLEGTEQDYRDRIFVAVNCDMFSLAPKKGDTVLVL